MVGSAYVLSDIIDHTDWERFKGYASRVQHLKYTPQILLDRSVWIYIADRLEGKPMLPNLRKLHTLNLTPADAAPVSLFVSPRNEVVRIAFDKEIVIPPSRCPAMAMMLFANIVKKAVLRLGEFSLTRFWLPPARLSLLGACRPAKPLARRRYRTRSVRRSLPINGWPLACACRTQDIISNGARERHNDVHLGRASPLGVLRNRDHSLVKIDGCECDLGAHPPVPCAQHAYIQCRRL
ncbi:hypothetical protein BD413DRAFT_577416 [Trametes elegans]|nr:hypothetical protein BD413DRAFT_577416 [Trametes elegans]